MAGVKGQSNRDSWFSRKLFRCSAREFIPGRALLLARGSSRLTNPMQTANTGECYHGRHTAGANVRREEGNNPDRQPTCKVMVGGERCGWGCPDSRCWLRSSHHLKKSVFTGRVGLRGRCNGAKPCTEAAAATLMRCWVGERSVSL